MIAVTKAIFQNQAIDAVYLALIHIMERVGTVNLKDHIRKKNREDRLSL